MNDTKKRKLIERKCARFGVVPMDYRGKVWFAEKTRKPITVNGNLYMKEELQPITPFKDGDPWYKFHFFLIDKRLDNVERFLEADRDAEELAASQQDSIFNNITMTLNQAFETSVSVGKDF